MAIITHPSARRNCAILGFAAFLVCATCVLFTTNLLLAIAFFSGWIGLGVAAISLWTLARARKGTTTNRSVVFLAHFAILVAALCYGYLASVLLAHTREKSVSVISSMNLRSISVGLRLYCEANGTPPGTLNDLIRAGMCTPYGLVSPLDPIRRQNADGSLIDSSYAYLADAAECGKSDDDIVACEREPWTPRDVRVFLQHQRQAVTRSGNVLLLDASNDPRLR